MVRHNKIASMALFVSAILGLSLSSSALANDTFTCNGDYYISQSENLFRVDTENSTYSFDKIDLTDAVTTNSLAFNFQDGYFYAVQNSGSNNPKRAKGVAPSPLNSHLIRMGQNGMEDLGEMVDMKGLTVTASFNKAGQTGQIYTVDMPTVKTFIM